MQTKSLSIGIYPKINAPSEVLDNFEDAFFQFECLLDEITNNVLASILPPTDEAMYYFEKSSLEILQEKIEVIQKILLPKLQKRKHRTQENFEFNGVSYMNNQKKHTIIFKCMNHLQKMINYALQNEVYILIEYTKKTN